MNVLVLGGTVFYGRQLVRTLVARGHRVTTFNRGNHDVDAHLPVTRIVGDRTNHTELARVASDGWDAVIDPFTESPDYVAMTARYFRTASRYIYISSISAYTHLDRPGTGEAAPIFTAPADDPASDESYGWRKAESEARVRAVFDDRSTLLRPGLIVGEFDPTDRFTSWVARCMRGGNVLVPGAPERNVQFIDVRDVVEFTLRTIEHAIGGTFNVTSARGKFTMRDVLDAARDGLETLPAATWVDERFLAQHGCEGWIDLPLWVPPDSAYNGIMDIDVGAALAAGLTTRPLAETIRSIRAWLAESGHVVAEAGLSPERETELLNAWTAAISS